MSGTHKTNCWLQIKIKAAFTQWKEQMSVIADSSAEHQLSIENDMFRLVSVTSSFAQPTCVSKNLDGDLFS